MTYSNASFVIAPQTVDYLVATGLTKALKEQQPSYPDCTYESVLGEIGRAFRNAIGIPVKVMAADIENWRTAQASDWVDGIDP